jgi:glucose-6-phosphate 1-dehydrogenase
MKTEKIQKEFAFVIFGASGDLAKLKIFPAIYELYKQNRLPKNFQIIGYARSEKSQKQFRKEFIESVKSFSKTKVSSKILKKLVEHVDYFSGQYNKFEDFKTLKEKISAAAHSKNIVTACYFSVPPSVFENIIINLGETRHKKEDIRLIIEKPFGEDCSSAKKLFHCVGNHFDEEEVYLLDHYLGKTSVQSILSMRHSNRILNLMMKGPAIANIQITAAESVGVNKRAGYFDKVGTIKDMFQSHLLQILALISMSIPITEDPSSLHREKENILSALRFVPSTKNLVLGQYKGYKNEEGIKNNSNTETFAAIRMFIDRESWFKVPIYIRTGKKLKAKKTKVVIELKKFAFQHKSEEANKLIFELQPEEKVSIKLINKHAITPDFEEVHTSDSIAYEGKDFLPEHGILLMEVLEKKRLHFLSFQEIIACWEITDKIVNFIKRKKLKPEIYEVSCDGPKNLEKLTKMDGFKWN